jgi:MarR family transcriptional regulator, 2-MHQ and catechol-resistance regulon repressor
LLDEAMPTHYKGSPQERSALDALIKLLRAADSVCARTQAHLARYQLTTSQFGVLEALLHLGPLHQNELGRKLLKSGGNITVVVDHLEQRGLVRRERDSVDRRRITVELTASGQKLIGALFPKHAAAVKREMGVLSEPELKQLGKLCKKFGLG